MDSSGSGSEDDLSKFTDITGCAEVKRLFDTATVKKDDLVDSKSKNDEYKPKEKHFEAYLAKVLAARLEELYKEKTVKRKHKSVPIKSASSSPTGIPLLSSSTCLLSHVAPSNDPCVIHKRRTGKQIKLNPEHFSEAAVSPKHILNRTGVSSWVDRYERRIIKVKVTKRLSKNAVECEVLPTPYISEQAYLINVKT